MWRSRGARAESSTGRDAAASAPDVPNFAYCEPVTAYAMGKQHIRQVGPEGLKPGGGVPGAALCGRDLLKGWDLGMPVTADSALSLVTPRAGDGHVWLCPRCYEVYQAQTASNG